MTEKKLNILMMIHRQADSSPYCFYVHEQAKALKKRGHRVTVISAVGVTPMMEKLRPGQAAVAKRTPKHAVVDGIDVYYPRYLTLGNAGEKLLGGRLLYQAALPVAKRLHKEQPFDIVHVHMLPRDGHAGLMTARALKIPCALTVHGTDIFHYFIPGKEPWQRNKAIANGVDALMAVSSLLMSRVSPYRGGEISHAFFHGGVQPADEPRGAVSPGGQNQPRRAQRRGSFPRAGKDGEHAARGDFCRHAQGA